MKVPKMSLVIRKKQFNELIEKWCRWNRRELDGDNVCLAFFEVFKKEIEGGKG